MRKRHDRYCDHHWMREDQNTKQCVKCGIYADVKE